MTKARNLARLASVDTSIVGNTVFLSGNVSLANATLSLGANTIHSTSLTSTGVVANSYGNTTAIPVITVDAAGRITNATTSSVSGVTGLSYTAANSTVTVSTSTTNFNAVVTSGNSTVQGLLTVIDSVSNTSTLIAGSANSVTTAYLLAANAVSNATAYAATAYSNAVATAASDATTKAGTAYSNAVSVASSDATTKAGTAYSNAIAYANTVAGTAYSNATTFATTAAGTAYSNAVSVASSDATTKAGTAYSNAIAYANTVAYTAAGTAYSNVFNGGTFSGAVTVQANLTANSVRMNGDLQIDGNLTVSGNSVTINVTNLNVEDNMIYLNSNSTVSHPDLGFAGNYNDGTYAHAGLFRDATDGVWKFFHGYTPEPDASVYIDTSNASFTYSNLQVNYVIGNVTGSANSATYVGGNTASTLRSYSDTIAGTAYSNAVSVASSDATTKAGTAYSNATTYAATIAGTAYSNAVSVASSDATTKAGTAYSNATTFATTIAGTAYSNAVSVASSDATTKAGTAYSNATTYAATIAGTAYSNAISYAATIAGTAYSNATAFAANASNISSGTLSSSRLPATYLTAESDTLATVTGRGASTSTTVTLSQLNISGAIVRSAAGAGYLNGNYSSSETVTTSGAIYSIGGTYVPGTTTLGNMYGVGYAYSGSGRAVGTNPAGAPIDNWGFYGADNGTLKWFLSTTTGAGYFTGQVNATIFYDASNTAYYSDPSSGSEFSTIYVDNWFRPRNQTGVYSPTYGIHFWPQAATQWGMSFAGNTSGYLALYQSYQTTIRLHLYYDTSGSGLLTNTGNWGVRQNYDGGASPGGTLYGAWISNGDHRAPVFYDSGDTSWYVDAASTSNLNKFSALTMSYNDMNHLSSNSPYAARYAGSANYRNGSMGHGTTALNTIFSNWGSGFWDSWSSPANAPGGSTHYVGIQGCHYNHLDGSSVYGFQMACAGEADNRFFWRRGWPSLTSWVEMIHTANINSLPSDLRAPIFYDRDNTGYYVDPNSTSRMNLINADNLRSYNDIYLDQNYGSSVIGLYTHTIFQGVFAMGNAYKLTLAGAINNLYGITWSYPSAGGIAGNLDSHGMIVAINGGFGSCMSYSIKASGNVTAYSDERLKTNWRDMPEDFVARLAKVKVGIYDRVDGEKITQVGVSAQSLQTLLPQAVTEANDDIKTLSVSYGNAAMASAVELAKEVVSLKQTISSQEERIAKLEALVNNLLMR